MEALNVSAGSLFIDLNEITAVEDPLVGGKGANLGLLCHAGFPVPDGFCLTTAAYDAVCGQAPLSALVQELVGHGSRTLGQLKQLAAAFRAAIQDSPIPPRVEETLQLAYSRLGANVAVAVRSSANAEDLPSASFAGQQETYLNVIGFDAVLDSVRACWGSLWTERALTYRENLSLDHAAIKTGVVIQRLVNARVSGVLFTANPLSGRRRETVIDASFGLGEAVVSGAVDPDHFVIDSTRRAITERRAGAKRLQVRPRKEGGTETVESVAEQPRWCLDDEQIVRLSDLGVRVEREFAGPQDVEWAIDDSGTVWLTQARPITTLFPLPDGAPDDPDDVRVYYSMNASQGMESPFTPMGASLFRVLSSSIAAVLGFPPRDALAGPAFVHHAAGRLYLDVTAALRNRIGRLMLTMMTSAAEARAASALKRLAADPRFSLKVSSPWPFVRKGLSFLLRLRLPFHLLQSLVSPEVARRRTAALAARLRALARLPQGAGAPDRFSLVVRLLSPSSLLRLLQIMPTTAVPAEWLLALARRLLGPLATAADLEEVQRGAPHNPTTEMDLALWSVARAIPEDSRWQFLEQPPGVLTKRYREGRLPPSTQAAVEGFLQEYGHRCAVELDGGLPAWAERPEPVFAIICNFLRAADTGRSPQLAYERSIQTALERKAELVRRARNQGLLKGALVRFSIERARDLLGFREMPRFLISLLLHLAREHILAIGLQLACDGLLGSGDDVFFLSLPEVREALSGKDMRRLANRRREEHERERHRRAPAVLLSDGTEPREDTEPWHAGEKTLRGLAASSGSAIGIARVVLDPTKARLEPGEILVAPSTDPGWTPLFLTAGAVVMETGGPMSHGAIVAREYGVPAVVAVPEATQRIRSGMRVAVDGTEGTVTIL